MATATQLRAARVRTPAVAAIYVQAGEATRFADPAAALAWFDDADDAGADPADTAAGRAEAGALLGLPVDVDPQAGDPRLARLAGAAAAQDGRAERAADTLLAADPVLAVPVLVGVGRLDQARARATRATAFAEAALAAAEDPDAAVPLLIEAAEIAERTAPAAVLPDTPHALGAIVAVAAGDVAAAEHLLERATGHAADGFGEAAAIGEPSDAPAASGAGFGGPAAAVRHRLLLAWARMRAGRYDSALAELARPEARPARPGTAAARRHRRRDRPPPRRHRRAAGRLGRRRARAGPPRRGPLAARGGRGAAGRRGPAAAAAAGRPGDRAARAHRRRGSAGRRPGRWRSAGCACRSPSPRGRPARRPRRPRGSPTSPAAGPGPTRSGRARPCGRKSLPATAVAPETVLAVTDRLAAAQLPWEASRLAGQAAIHATDPNVARRLLERARELSEPDSTGADAQPSAKVGRASSLSERELAVAKLVLAGSTHREIGAQLYIAPKTVEHHVARIRSKLGAGSRAELLAVLREIVSDPG